MLHFSLKLMKKCWFFILISAHFAQAQINLPMEKQELPCQIIFKIDVNVVSKRPDKNGAPLYKYALLNICPERQGEIQRQVIGIIWQEKKVFREFERELVFKNEKKALVYAEINHIPMAYFKDNPERVEYVSSLRENGLLPNDIFQDLVMVEIKKKLPPDWEFIQTEAQKKEYPNTFSLKAQFKVWELAENKINAPVSHHSRAEELARIKKYGKEVYPQITFGLHQPWREEELKAVGLAKGSPGDNPLTRFYRNTQFFGIKTLTINGLEDSFHTVVYQASQTTIYQIYELIRGILEPKILIGKAQNAKMGACFIADNQEVYFIEKWREWQAQHLGKRFIIKGLEVSITTHSNQTLMNDKGEYRSGAEGTFNYLVRVELPETRKSMSMVVVFKKEISEKNTQEWLDKTGYYFHTGADSSKGKIYHSKTGKKYHIYFPNEAEKTEFLKKYQNQPEIYEIYEPNWDIIKD
jgi:hypothetical protein